MRLRAGHQDCCLTLCRALLSSRRKDLCTLGAVSFRICSILSRWVSGKAVIFQSAGRGPRVVVTTSPLAIIALALKTGRTSSLTMEGLFKNLKRSLESGMSPITQKGQFVFLCSRVRMSHASVPHFLHRIRAESFCSRGSAGRPIPKQLLRERLSFLSRGL